MLYNRALARFYIEEEEVSESQFWLDSFLLKLNKSEKEKEKRISEIMSEVRLVGFGSTSEHLSEKLEIAEGYSAIKSSYTEKDTEE